MRRLLSRYAGLKAAQTRTQPEPSTTAVRPVAPDCHNTTPEPATRPTGATEGQETVSQREWFERFFAMTIEEALERKRNGTLFNHE